MMTCFVTVSMAQTLNLILKREVLSVVILLFPHCFISKWGCVTHVFATLDGSNFKLEFFILVVFCCCFVFHLVFQIFQFKKYHLFNLVKSILHIHVPP